MRGISIIILLIAMLIVGMLVTKNYHSTQGENSEKSQKVIIQKTEKAVKSAEEATNKIKQTAEILND